MPQTDSSATRIAQAPQLAVQRSILGCANRFLPPFPVRHACPPSLRQTFHEFSDHSRKRCAWAKTLYQHYRSTGKKYHAAVRALAFIMDPHHLQNVENPNPL